MTDAQNLPALTPEFARSVENGLLKRISERSHYHETHRMLTEIRALHAVLRAIAPEVPKRNRVGDCWFCGARTSKPHPEPHVDTGGYGCPAEILERLRATKGES